MPRIVVPSARLADQRKKGTLTHVFRQSKTQDVHTHTQDRPNHKSPSPSPRVAVGGGEFPTICQHQLCVPLIALPGASPSIPGHHFHQSLATAIPTRYHDETERKRTTQPTTSGSVVPCRRWVQSFPLVITKRQRRPPARRIQIRNDSDGQGHREGERENRKLHAGAG